MSRLFWPHLVSLALASASVTACGEANAAPGGQEDSVADDRGGVHNVLPSRARVVSLVPGITETLLAIGAAEVLLARTRFDEQDQLAHLPSVGGGLDPSLEYLASLDPELVIMWRDPGGSGSLSAGLEDLGIAAYQVDVQEFADFRRHARNVGRLTGRAPEAEALVGELDQALNDVRRAVAGLPAPGVLYLVQSSPPMGVGPGTFLDSLIVVAGGRNILREASGRWPLLSLEDILWRDPGYVVVPVVDYGAPDGAIDAMPEPLRRLATEPGWAEVGAVRGGRLVAVDAALFGRPGPRMAEAARFLAERLHPEAFVADSPSP